MSAHGDVGAAGADVDVLLKVIGVGNQQRLVPARVFDALYRDPGCGALREGGAEER